MVIAAANAALVPGVRKWWLSGFDSLAEMTSDAAVDTGELAEDELISHKQGAHCRLQRSKDRGELFESVVQALSALVLVAYGEVAAASQSLALHAPRQGPFLLC